MIRTIVILVVTMAAVAKAQLPRPSADTAAFVSATREATERYQDQGTALREGYRRIGPDFPSMGEHWLNRTLVMRGEVDPRRPPILEYINVAGRPVLAGVAFAQLVYDQPPESSIPASASDWHYHAGSVDEESFIASHANHSASTPSSGARIAVLHAWVWLDNPAGLFATDNWDLPWLRLGLESPVDHNGPDPTTLAVALAAGGAPYFSSLLRIRHSLNHEMASQLAALLQRRAELLRSQVRAGGENLGATLSAGWQALAEDFRAICPGCAPLMPPHH